MNSEERDQYVRHRMETAFQTLEAAQLLADNKYWNSAVNRLYYAVFHAVNALLVFHEIDTQSHSGLKSKFSYHFIKPGTMDKKYGKLLAELYDWRQKGDYNSITEFNSEIVLPLFDPAREMIETIKSKIQSS